MIPVDYDWRLVTTAVISAELVQVGPKVFPLVRLREQRSLLLIQIEAAGLHALQREVGQGRLFIASQLRPNLMSMLGEVVLCQFGDLDSFEATIARFRRDEVLDIFLVHFLIFVVTTVHRVEHHAWPRRVHLRLNFFPSDR